VEEYYYQHIQHQILRNDNGFENLQLRPIWCYPDGSGCLREKNVPYKLVLVDMSNGEHKSPEHLEKQPFGQVPYIDDDGFTLYESRAIARYVEKRHPNQGTKLIPDDLQNNALFEQAASMELVNFFPPTFGLLMEKMGKKHLGQDTDEAAYQAHRSTLDNKLKVATSLSSISSTCHMLRCFTLLEMAI
jgi:glutathione S-transferase